MQSPIFLSLSRKFCHNNHLKSKFGHKASFSSDQLILLAVKQNVLIITTKVKYLSQFTTTDNQAKCTKI